MMNSRAIAIPLCALVILLMRSPVSGAGESTQTAPGGGTGSATSGHVLPLFQDKVPEAYREHVPLPYGVSWNPAVGAELGLTRHIRANLEAGFGGRKYLLLGAGYRF